MTNNTPTIILAFDSFKGCMSADDACMAAAEGIRSVYPDANIISMPLSDGGEGLVHCISKLRPVEEVTIDAHGPLMESIKASYALSADRQTAYMEMAATSGLTLVPMDKRNPMLTTTYGVGEMIIDATRRGCKHIIMGIGGSATCDGGKGMIQSLEGFHDIPKITVACDVTNPLYGPNGAAHIFAPQKGATPEQVILLDQMLKDFAATTEQRGIASPSMATYPGAGAAGGLGYGLMAYLGATLQSGIDTLLRIAEFDTLLHHADLVITGEGQSDAQTLMGKVPFGVLAWSKRMDVPVLLLSGGIKDADQLTEAGFITAASINEDDQRPLATLMQRTVAMDNMRKTIAKLTASFLPNER